MCGTNHMQNERSIIIFQIHAFTSFEILLSF